MIRKESNKKLLKDLTWQQLVKLGKNLNQYSKPNINMYRDDEETDVDSDTHETHDTHEANNIEMFFHNQPEQRTGYFILKGKWDPSLFQGKNFNDLTASNINAYDKRGMAQKQGKNGYDKFMFNFQKFVNTNNCQKNNSSLDLSGLDGNSPLMKLLNQKNNPSQAKQVQENSSQLMIFLNPEQLPTRVFK